MKKVIITVIFILVIGLVARGIQRNIDASKQKIKSITELQGEQGVPVNVEKVVRQTIQETQIYSGTFKGKDQADATAKIMERLERVLVRAGDRVKKGQVVAQLSPQNPSARSQQARLSLENAEKELKRMEALFKEGAVSQQDVDNIELRYKVAKEDFDAVNELVNVVSPISGVVTEIFQDPGVTVGPGIAIVRVASLDAMELETEVGESDIFGIKKGQKAYVSFSGNNQPLEGAVDRVSLSADPKSRNFRVWITVSNKDGLLRPGMFATARLVIRESPESLLITKDSIVKSDSGSYAFVVNSDNIAEKRMLKLGIVNEKHVQVLEGMQEGEQLIVLGQSKLKGGEKVLIRQ